MKKREQFTVSRANDHERVSSEWQAADLEHPLVLYQHIGIIRLAKQTEAYSKAVMLCTNLFLP